MAQTSHKAQGWYGDPFHLHSARWFSNGSPTALVIDDGVESQDPPPSTWYITNLLPAPQTEGGLIHA